MIRLRIRTYTVYTYVRTYLPTYLPICTRIPNRRRNVGWFDVLYTRLFLYIIATAMFLTGSGLFVLLRDVQNNNTSTLYRLYTLVCFPHYRSTSYISSPLAVADIKSKPAYPTYKGKTSETFSTRSLLFFLSRVLRYSLFRSLKATAVYSKFIRITFLIFLIFLFDRIR